MCAFITDLLTGEKFEQRRSSQKFSKADNRVKFWNEKAKEIRKAKAYADKPLFRNFKILSELMKGIKEKDFHSQFLLGRGFDFKVFNHYEYYNEKRYPAVYRYVVIPLQNDIIKIYVK